MAGRTRVLVVDDSALMRKALKAMLVDGGFDVETARNGVDALEQVRRDPPDVVTLDVNMPEMDGLTCLSRIMAEHPLPVVMVSSLTDSAAKVTFEALELGAVDYVAKPGGTVSLDIDTVRAELVAKVRGAAGATVRRAGGLRERLRRQREAAGLLPSPTTSPERAAPLRAAGTTRTASRVAARTSAVRSSPRRTALVPDLVLVGSSTGGPSALGEVLSALPAGFLAPVVVAQHIPESFTRHLAGRLDADCALAVREVTGTEPLRPGVVYIGRGDADVVVSRRPDGLVVKSVPASDQYRWHPSVDRLVASALTHAHDVTRLVGVLLTGMGDDGAAEMTRLRELGGRTVAESQETAVVWGMPGDLVRRDGADLVLPLDAIGPQLASWG